MDSVDGPVSASASDTVDTSDPLALLDDVPLSDIEAGYVEAARAGNTLRGYRSDWAKFSTWSGQFFNAVPLPANPAQTSTYLTELAQAGARVGTLSRRPTPTSVAPQTVPSPTRPDTAR